MSEKKGEYPYTLITALIDGKTARMRNTQLSSAEAEEYAINVVGTSGQSVGVSRFSEQGSVVFSLYERDGRKIVSSYTPFDPAQKPQIKEISFPQE